MRNITMLIVLSLFLACSGSKKVTSDDSEAVYTEQRQLDTMVVSASPPDSSGTEVIEEPIVNTLPVYRASHERMIDILHTDIEVSFNWEQELVLGKAVISLKPYFFPTDRIELDAKDFDIHRVIKKSSGEGLDYEYNGQKIVITLEEELERYEKVEIEIEYTAHPGETGGSDAITSDKGLFFINPDGSEEKPQQIWTQGETEHNSKWFPTVDKPNERMTTDIHITVDDKFKTLSNGIFVNSKSDETGKRTDHWRMDQPHAPYLVMLAVGDFVKVEDTWKDIPLGYWVEPEYEKDAEYIFDNTPEMLTYFSELIDVDYPWQKYDQIVVRDYVSGAMENTTAVIFGDFVQRRKRDLVDNNNDRIVAHELFHHWFGDLVTTESWSNLTLNEGFANYSEHLWRVHKYGKYEGQAQLFEEKYGYIFSSSSGIHPLIDFQYADKEDMFDAHSYNKGGLVLHMLRNYLGDEAFFAGLKTYLEDNEYRAVEVHDLRLAFEKVTGKDLNWFFNQWFLRAGHPELNINYSYDSLSQRMEIEVEQIQDAELSIPIFQVPAVFDVYHKDGTKERFDFWLDQRNQKFVIDNLLSEPHLVNFDPDHVQLAVVNQNYSGQDATYLINHTDHVADVMQNARNAIRAKIDVAKLLSHPSKDVKLMAMDLVNPTDYPQLVDTLKNLALGATNSFVQAKAISTLSNIGIQLDEVKLIAMIQSQNLAYRVVDAALDALHKVNPDEAMEVLHTINIEESTTLLASAGSIFSSTGDSKHLKFFEKNAPKISGETALDFYSSYTNLLAMVDYSESESKWNELISGVAREGDLYSKYGVVKGIGDLLKKDEERKIASSSLKNFASKIIDSVDNPQYKSYFQSMIR